MVSTNKTAGRLKRGNGWIADILKNPFSYLLLLPAAAYVFIFGYMTLPYIVIAFQNYNYKLGLFGSEFVGLKNFEFFFKSNRAWNVTFNTVYLNLLFIITGTIASVGLALMLNEIANIGYKKISQSVLIFPHFLSWVIVQYIVYALLSTNYGFLNRLLESIGIEKISLYSSAKEWPLLLVIIRIWKGAGMNSVIYIAAITGMDEGLFESARIDGANKRQQIQHITLPLLAPTICILTLLSIGKIFYGDFQMIYALVGDNGILLERTDVIDTFVFRALRQTGDPAGAMAVGLYQALVGFIFVFGSNRLTKRYFPDGALF